MKRLSIKKAIVIFIIYIAISYGCITYFDYFPPLSYVRGKFINDRRYYDASKIIFPTGGILLVGFLFYYTDWKKPKNDE